MPFNFVPMLASLGITAAGAGLNALTGRSREEEEALKMIQARARGEGPSPAAMQARNQGQQVVNGMQTMAAATPGGNPIAAMREASMAGSQAIQGAATAGALARAQEQNAAQAQLAQLGQRQTDWSRQLMGGITGALGATLAQGIAASPGEGGDGFQPAHPGGQEFRSGQQGGELRAPGQTVNPNLVPPGTSPEAALAAARQPGGFATGAPPAPAAAPYQGPTNEQLLALPGGQGVTPGQQAFSVNQKNNIGAEALQMVDQGNMDDLRNKTEMDLARYGAGRELVGAIPGFQVQPTGAPHPVTAYADAFQQAQNAGPQGWNPAAPTMSFTPQQAATHQQMMGLPWMQEQPSIPFGPFSMRPRYSDERLKSEIRDATGMEADQFIAALRGRRFNLNAGPDQGPRTGIMAQDIARTAIGREMVSQGPQGLQVDPQRALEASLAAVGRLGDRVAELEGNRELVMGDAQNIRQQRGADYYRGFGRSGADDRQAAFDAQNPPPSLNETNRLMGQAMFPVGRIAPQPPPRRLSREELQSTINILRSGAQMSRGALDTYSQQIGRPIPPPDQPLDVYRDNLLQTLEAELPRAQPAADQRPYTPRGGY